jgi:hypothetical protein
VREALDVDDLRDNVVVAMEPRDIVEFVNEVITHAEAECTLLVDDVELADVHTLEKRLQPAVGRIRLITIGLREMPALRVEAPDLALGPLDDNALRAVVEEQSQLGESQAQWIVEVSQGYPRLAIEIANALRQDPIYGDLGRLVEHQHIATLLSRMLESDVRKDLAVLALFKTVGVSGDRAFESEAVAAAFARDAAAFRANVEREAGRFVAAGGRLRSVTPKIMAVWLVRQALDEYGPQIVDRINALPDPLPDRFREQLRYFGDAPNVVEMIERALEGLDFRDPDAFDSAAARFLLAAAASAPRQVAEALQLTVMHATDETLRSETFPRRDVVWTLEQLLWPTDTYELAADSLLRLAENETETYSNSATGVLIDSFQLSLGGTELPLGDRVSWMRRRLDEQSTTTRTGIAARALSAAFRTHQVRSHGFSPASIAREDWRPASWDEQHEMMRKAWIALAHVLDVAPAEARPPTIDAFAEALAGATSAGLAADVAAAIETREWRPNERAKLADHLRAALRREDLRREDDRGSLVHALQRIEGGTLMSRLEVALSSSVWSLRDRDDDWNAPPAALVALADEASEDADTHADAVAVAAHAGDPNTVFVFVQELARRAGAERIGNLAAGFAHLSAVPLIAAIAAAARDTGEVHWADRQLHVMTEQEHLLPHLVDAVRAAGANSERIHLLLDTVRSGRLPPDALGSLVFGAPVQEHDPATAREVLDVLSEAESPVAIENALIMLRQFLEAAPNERFDPRIRSAALALANRVARDSRSRALALHELTELLGTDILDLEDRIRLALARLDVQTTFLMPDEERLLDTLLSQEPARVTDAILQWLRERADPEKYWQSAVPWVEEQSLLSRSARAAGAVAVWSAIRDADDAALRHSTHGFRGVGAGRASKAFLDLGQTSNARRRSCRGVLQCDRRRDWAFARRNRTTSRTCTGLG